jgi:hypothetical protein
MVVTPSGWAKIVIMRAMRAARNVYVLLIVFLLSACNDDMPIFGKWRSETLFPLEIEFQPDKYIANGGEELALYELNGDSVIVHLKDGTDTTVKVLDRNHIEFGQLEWRRVDDSESRSSDPFGGIWSGEALLSFLSGIFGSTTESTPPSVSEIGGTADAVISKLSLAVDNVRSLFDATAGDGIMSTISSMLSRLFDPSAADQRTASSSDITDASPAVSKPKPNVSSVDSVLTTLPKTVPDVGTTPPQIALLPSPTAAPAEPAVAAASPSRKPAEPVVNLQALPVGDWQKLSRYHAGKIGELSNQYLDDWYGTINCNAYKRDRRDEFAMAEHRKEAQRELASAHVGNRIRVPLQLTLGEYDFDQKSFALDPLKKGDVIRIQETDRCRVYSHDEGIPYTFDISLDEDAPWRPLLPMAETDAHAVVQSFQQSGRREVSAEMVVDLGEVYRNVIDARPVALYVWKDDEHRVFLGAVGNALRDSEARQSEAASLSVPPVEPTNSAAPNGTSQPPASATSTPQSTAAAPSQSGVSNNTTAPAQPANSALPVASQSPTSTASSAQAAPSQPTVSGKATVVNTAILNVNGVKISLAGIEGVGGTAATQLQGFLTSQGDQVTCTPSGDRYTCVTSKGVDVAEAALLNGAAKASSAASERYKSLEQDAKTKHRGIWAN